MTVWNSVAESHAPRAVGKQARHRIGVIRPRGNAPENPAFPRGAITIDLWPDPPGHVRLPRTDDEVIARGVAFQALAGRKVKLLTGDIGMSTRA